MEWVNYTQKIVKERGVKLVEWPEDVPISKNIDGLSIPTLQLLVCKLKSGEIHWVEVNEEELRHIAPEQRKRLPRKDKGKKRSKRAPSNDGEDSNSSSDSNSLSDGADKAETSVRPRRRSKRVHLDTDGEPSVPDTSAHPIEPSANACDIQDGLSAQTGPSSLVSSTVYGCPSAPAAPLEAIIGDSQMWMFPTQGTSSAIAAAQAELDNMPRSPFRHMREPHWGSPSILRLPDPLGPSGGSPSMLPSFPLPPSFELPPLNFNLQ